MWRDQAYLLDILIAARQARAFAAGLTWERFEQSPLHQHAVMRTLEIIGEAARKISKDTKEACLEIPWTDLSGMRHRLVHEYFRIDLQQVWKTVQSDIPRLIALVEPLVPPEKP